MRRHAWLRLGLIALFVSVLAACGKSGSRDTRPIEVLYYVSGVQGLPFQLLPEPSPPCGSGAGLQAENADHRFGERVFRAPHLFVMENAAQPVRGVFANLDDSPDPESLRVDLYLGTFLQATEPAIAAGDCATVGTDTADDLQPEPKGRSVRIEVCSRPEEGDRSAPCASEEPDAGVAFFASLGDIEDSNLTSCQILPVLESCRTRATFFIENPQEVVSAVFSKLSDQNPDAVLRVELYVDEDLKDVETGKGDVVVTHDL